MEKKLLLGSNETAHIWNLTVEARRFLHDGPKWLQRSTALLIDTRRRYYIWHCSECQWEAFDQEQEEELNYTTTYNNNNHQHISPAIKLHLISPYFSCSLLSKFIKTLIIPMMHIMQQVFFWQFCVQVYLRRNIDDL